jgi:hypothetical protein
MSAIQWSAIDWVSLIALSLLVLIVARIGEQLSFGNRGVGALITALLFAVGFAAWSYSVHDQLTHALATFTPTGRGWGDSKRAAGMTDGHSSLVALGDRPTSWIALDHSLLIFSFLLVGPENQLVAERHWLREEVEPFIVFAGTSSTGNLSNFDALVLSRETIQGSDE